MVVHAYAGAVAEVKTNRPIPTTAAMTTRASTGVRRRSSVDTSS